VFKNIKLYFVISALLHGGHFILVEFFPLKFSIQEVFLTQSYLFVLFVLADFAIRFFTKYLNLILGQSFLTFSTVKLLTTGAYVLVLKKAFHMDLNNWFIVIFMISYFTFLALELLTFLKELNSADKQDL
jgi:hypothetical protein